MLLLIIGLVFINFVFFLLIGIGSISMANVEGVAEPWLTTLIPYWIAAHIPYVFYVFNLIKDHKNGRDSTAIKRSISRSAWIALPGGIALFMFVGSKIPWAAVVIPFIQTLIAIIVYKKNQLLKTDHSS
jgi:hypothetical protein